MKTSFTFLQLVKLFTLFLIIAIFFAFQHNGTSQKNNQNADQIRQDTIKAGQWFSIGKVFADSAQIDSSLHYFKKALGIYEAYREEDRDDALWQAYFNCQKKIASANYRNASFEEAMERADLIIEKAISNFGELDTIVADGYYLKGMVNWRMGNHNEALVNFNLTKNIRERSYGENHISTANAYNAIGLVYRNIGDLDQAMDHFQKAYDIKSSIVGDEKIKITSVLNNIALIYLDQSKFELAAKGFNELLVIEKKHYGEKHLQLADTYSNLGIVYYNQGKYEKAANCFDLSLQIKKRYLPDEHPDIAYGYFLLATIYEIQGKYDPALSNLNQALSIQKSVFGDSHPRTAETYNGLGILYEELGAYDESLQNFQKSLVMRKTIYGDESLEVASVLNNIGYLFELKKEYSKALEYHQQALKTKEKILGGNHFELADTYGNLGLVYDRLGDFNLAIKHYEKQLSILVVNFEEKNPQTANSFINLAGIHADIGAYQESLNYYQKALQALIQDFSAADIYSNPEINSKVQNFPALLETLRGKARALFLYYVNDSENLKDLEASANTCKLAFGLVEDMRKSYNWIDSKKELYENAAPLYELSCQVFKALYQESGDEAFLEDIFMAIEKSKSIRLLETISDEKAKSFYNLPADLLDKEYDLKTSLSYYEKLLFEEELREGIVDSVSIQAYKSKIFALKKSSDSLLLAFENGHPEYFKLRHDLQTVSVKIIQDQILAQDEVLIEYFVGDSSVFVYTITKDQKRLLEIPRDFPLQEWVEQFQKGIYEYHLSGTASESRYHALADSFAIASYQLYQKIFKPVLDQSNLPKKLTIVPDGLLGYIPFELLLQEKPDEATHFSNHAYLLKDYQISYSYSATMLLEMKEKQFKTSGKKKLLAFAPSFKEKQAALASRNLTEIRNGLGALKYNIREAEAIHNTFGGDIFTGDLATEEKFIDLSSQYQILHLATHGKANDKVGDYSYLAFSEIEDSTENEFLYTRDLYNMRINADMVVLSACETGVGELQYGEGIVSLARGFSYAGVKSIITSLWSINDQSTTELMTSFYSYLKKGKTKDAALRQAKLDYLQLHPNEEVHPFYWGAFIAIGDMAPISDSRANFWIWGLTIAVLGFLFFILFQRKKA